MRQSGDLQRSLPPASRQSSQVIFPLSNVLAPKKKNSTTQCLQIFNESGRLGQEVFHESAKLEQYALDSPVVGAVNVFCDPIFTEQIFGHFDNNVVGRGAGVIVVTGETLQAGRA